MFIPIKANYGCEFSLTFLSNTIQFNSIRHHQYEHDEVDDDNTSRLSAPMRSSRSSRVTCTGVTCKVDNWKRKLLVQISGSWPHPWQSWRFFVFVFVFVIVFVFVFWSQYLFNHLIHGEAGGSSLSASESTLTCFCVPGTWHLAPATSCQSTLTYF